MKVSGQRNASVVLPPGIEGRCPLNRKLDGSYSVSGLFWTCNRWNFVCLPWRSGQHVPLKIQYNSTILDGTTNQNPTTFVVSHHKSKFNICRQPSQIKIQRHLSSAITNQNPTTFVVSTVRTSNVTTLNYVQNRRLFIDSISAYVVNLPSTKQWS